MFTIRTRIIAASTSAFGLMLVLLASVIYQRTGDAELSKLDAWLESHADKISTELEEENDEGRPLLPGDLRQIATEGLTGVRMQVLDRDGNTQISDSVLAAASAAKMEFSRAGSQRKQTLEIAGRSFRCIWLASEADEHLPYIVQVAAPMDEISRRQESLLMLLTLTIPSALFLTAFFVWLITRIAFRPMAGMIETAREISGSNLDRRLNVPDTGDEVSTLGESLNQMIGRIQKAFRSQQQFVADASHEIRTPLTVIYNELEFVEQHVTDPVVKESLQATISETDRLAKLAEGLLLLAKLDASQVTLTLETFRVDELLMESVQMVSGMAQRAGVIFRVNLDDPMEIAADRAKLKSIFVNLLENAIKYSPANSTVTLTMANRHTDPDAVIVSVQDQGAGIPSSSLPFIFDRFYRVDSARSQTNGHGLGLAIVKQLLELHGGKIFVQSEIGKGSVFTVELPSKSVV